MGLSTTDFKRVQRGLGAYGLNLYMNFNGNLIECSVNGLYRYLLLDSAFCPYNWILQ